MSDQTKSRFAVDLDDLERQLRQTAGGQPRAVHNDPLAELARIVGQDDPFKAMFAERKTQAPVSAPAPAPSAPVYSRSETPQDDNRRAVPSEMMRAGHDMAAASPSRDVDAAPSAAPLDKEALDEFDALLQAELRGGISARDRMHEKMQDSSQVNSIAAELERELSAERQFAGSANPGAARDTELMTDGGMGWAPQDLDDPGHQSWAKDARQTAVSHASTEALAYPEPPEDPQEDMRSLEPQQPRKGLVIAGALLGVAALGIGAVVGLRGLSGPVRTNGDPPVIRAEAGPTKVQPQNPGGVEIPNQNKQILERTPDPKAADTRVVNREEQPMDVQAAARATPRIILPGPATGPATPVQAAAPAPPTTPAPPASPAASPAAPAVEVPAPSASGASSVAATPPAPQGSVAALGEPRRVRTVAVRPDGSIAPVNGAATPALPAAAAPVTTASSPPLPRAGVAAVAPRPPTPPRSEEAAAPRPPSTPAQAQSPARTQVAAAPPSAAVPPPAAVEPSSGGGFMIQLGAPGSESEARATFASLQRRFSDQLASDQPTIRRAEVGNGRTVYRLRVGPYGREAAAEKCEALKAAGGNCFIARN